MEPKAQLGELDTNCNSSSFLKGVMKMADIDINPFGEHDKPDEGMSEHLDEGEMIPIKPGGVIGDQARGRSRFLGLVHYACKNEESGDKGPRKSFDPHPFQSQEMPFLKLRMPFSYRKCSFVKDQKE